MWARCTTRWGSKPRAIRIFLTASAGGRVVTPSGMVLDGSLDKITPPPAQDPQNGNEVDPAVVDHLEFYLLNYFKPGHGQQNDATETGREVFNRSVVPRAT